MRGYAILLEDMLSYEPPRKMQEKAHSPIEVLLFNHSSHAAFPDVNQ